MIWQKTFHKIERFCEMGDLWRKEYLRRIDKAIEYIDADYINGEVNGLSWLEVRKLLDILQGSDKE